MTYHIAQANYARMKAPLDDPVMAGFVAELDRINAAADASEGFIWRLQGDQGDATDIQVFNDDTLIFNMSVWESIDALFQYTYRSVHVEPFRKRLDWFEKLDKPAMVLWWIPAGHIPPVAEAEERFRQLETDGPTPAAFTFKTRFPSPAHQE